MKSRSPRGNVEEVPQSGSSAWRELYDNALRHVHALILQDLSPPFMVEAFRVKHNNTMRAYTRAAFLNWDARISALVFGSTITNHFRKKTRRYGLEFAGVRGRPLYACGAQKPISDSATSSASSTFCENLASMSPLLQFKGERLLWRCADAFRLMSLHPRPDAYSACSLS